eukprot:94858-Rhodomonas_salina.1
MQPAPYAVSVPLIAFQRARGSKGVTGTGREQGREGGETKEAREGAREGGKREKGSEGGRKRGREEEGGKEEESGRESDLASRDGLVEHLGVRHVRAAPYPNSVPHRTLTIPSHTISVPRTPPNTLSQHC